ncbi:MAG TPA: hypothetical protein VFM75_00410 [Modicisalibacter sp.]|nr:hypothetical protein [Modicisalibacter sp.]
MSVATSRTGDEVRLASAIELSGKESRPVAWRIGGDFGIAARARHDVIPFDIDKPSDPVHTQPPSTLQG